MKYNAIILLVMYLNYVTANSKPIGTRIAEAGYPFETHWVTTPDGYYLCLHRIPYGKDPTYNQYNKTNKKVALLQHGLFLSSANWILFGPKKSLGFILADHGYDVWMGNARGNVYSRNHTTLNYQKDATFWDFSWHEIGYTDLPTMIDYVLQVTGTDGVYYVGHSQGTTSFYVMASLKPEYNAKIKVHISLAPVAYVKYVLNPLIHLISNYLKIIDTILALLSIHEILSFDGNAHHLSKVICNLGIFGRYVCKTALIFSFGFNFNELNLKKIPLIVDNFPAGASKKQFIHYVQEVLSCRFRQYDHGPIKNLLKYGTYAPPDYNLTAITAPAHLFYSNNDWLIGTKDVKRLSQELGNLKEYYLVPQSLFNHIDFIFGSSAPKLVFKKIVSVFAKY